MALSDRSGDFLCRKTEKQAAHTDRLLFCAGFASRLLWVRRGTLLCHNVKIIAVHILKREVFIRFRFLLKRGTGFDSRLNSAPDPVHPRGMDGTEGRTRRGWKTGWKGH